MADNKKRKKLADYIEVTLPGTDSTVRVERGDISEEEWKKLSEGQREVVVRDAPENLQFDEGTAEDKPSEVVVRDAPENLQFDEGAAPAPEAEKEPAVDIGIGDVTRVPDAEPTGMQFKGADVLARSNGDLFYRTQDGQEVAVKPWRQSSAPVDPGGQQESTSTFDKFASAVGRLPEKVGQMFGGSPEEQLADPVEEGTTRVTRPAPATPPAPTATPAAPPAPGKAVSGSVSVRQRTGGAPMPGGSSEVDRLVREQQQLLDGASKLSADAVAKKADVDRQQLISEKQLREQALRDREALQEQETAARAAYSKTLADGQAALSNIAQQRRALLQQRVDPDRYWNEAGAGKKVLAVLAGALHGWGGNGMQYIDHLQGLVDRDIAIQQSELKRRGGVLDDMMGDQKNIIAAAKEKGMSDLAAVEAARVSRYQELEDQLKMLAAESGIQATNPNLAMSLAGLAEKKAMHTENLAKFLQLKATQDSQTALGFAKLRQDEREMQLKMKLAMAKENEGQQLKPQQTARLAEIFNSSKQMSDMMKNYREKIGFGSSVSQFAPGGATDAAKWRDAMRGFAKSIGRGIEGGKMTDKDEDSILNSFIPTATDTKGNAEFKARRLAQYAADKYRSELQALGIGDYRTHGQPSPEEFQTFLEQQMGLTPAEPLPGETPRQ